MEDHDRPPVAIRPGGHVTDHMANERTFLAWIRTALGLIGIGFVLARMGLFLQQLAKSGGIAPHPSPRGSYEFLITGIVFLLLGTAFCISSGRIYQRSRVAIDEARYEPSRHAVTILTAVVVTGSLVIIGLLLWQVVTLDDG